MKSLSRNFGKFIVGLSLLTLPLNLYSEAATQDPAVVQQDVNIPVGTRPFSHSDHVKVQEERALLDEGTTPSTEARMSFEEKTRTQDGEEELVAKKMYYTSHDAVFHRPLAVSCAGDYVTLEDGSIWSVRIKDRYKTLDWLTNDTIMILPNHSWFSTYHYVLLNQTTGKSVKVNMYLGPIYNGIFTHWIIAVDYYNNDVWLEDGSVWKISDSDHSIVNKWLINDTVVIGINDSWFSSKPNILINVNMLNYAKGLCIN